MQLTIFAAGSRGDIQPCAMLGQGLQRAGFGVRLAAPANFADFACECGLDFHPLGGDVQQIMASEAGRQYMEGGSGNPLVSIRAMRTMLGPVALQMAEDALAACHDADALVALAVFATFAQTIAELRGIPLILVEPTPLLPTSAFPAPGWPLQRDLGAVHNRLSGVAMLQVIWQWYRPRIIRAVNKKTIWDIQAEIRDFQGASEASEEAQFIRWFVLLPALVRRLFYWLLFKNPQVLKRHFGTVALSSIGMFGTGGFWGVPVPNHTLQLTLGGIAEKPGVVDGRIEIREYLSVTMSFDHDIVDGAPAARFAQHLKELVERADGLAQ